MPKADGAEIVQQLFAAGLDEFTRNVCVEDCAVRGILVMRGVIRLRLDERFIEGRLHGLHGDVGVPRTEFRSVRGSCGSGSLQIVINLHTGVFYSDVDIFNPYADVVNWLGHAFGEVVPNWLRRRKPSDSAET